MSKCNHSYHFIWNAVKHYGLRKLSVGVVSVLLGSTFLLGSAAHADVVPTQSEVNSAQTLEISGGDQPVLTTSNSANVDLAVNENESVPSQDEDSYNPNDQGNYANLEQATIDDQGRLNVAGWHATNFSKGHPYHYIIILDSTDSRELGRVNVTDQAVQRTDVANVHPVYGASRSGFATSFNLSSQLAKLDRIQIISRYTDDAVGNGNAVDYWFAPITVDRNNRANLDQTEVGDDQLTVRGWHATNLAANKPYHIIILFDQTLNHEIARVNAKQCARPDVAKAFPGVVGASKSGFTAKFNVQKIDFSHQLQIISRYSSNADGNSDYIDYWFAPLTIDKDNRAHVDQATVANNQLVINGWHATNLATNKLHHVVILFDRTLGHEVTRVDAEQCGRPDVAKAFPGVAGADRSGFIARFGLQNINFNHQLQIISRYSSNAAANSDYIDYWFAPLTSGQEVNQGYLDNYDFSDGKNLKVSGWHASGLSQFENNHFIILFDTTTNSQVAVTKAAPVNRPDIAKFLPNVYGSSQSGFSVDFNSPKLHAGHTYTVVSRYSTSSTGNGDHGQYTDLWTRSFTVNDQGQGHYIESIKMIGNGLQVAGWLVDGQSIDKPYAYAIVLNNGREVARQRLNLHQRTDISRIYPHIYGSLYSGFNELVNFNPSKITGNLSIILRYTDDPAGNGDFSDQYSGNYLSNDGNYDQVDVTANNVKVVGWHASDQSIDKPYQFIIILSESGQEIDRRQITNNIARPDLIEARPYIYNSGNAGFSANLTVPSNLAGHMFTIIHRFSGAADGNSQYIDYSATYYLLPNGQLASGLIRKNGNSYHFDVNTHQMTKNASYDGVYFDGSGRLVNGGFSSRIINWFVNREGKLTYSQTGSRDGSDGTADCSGSVTAAVAAAGGSHPAYVYNTRTLPGYLLANGYRLVYQGDAEITPQYGDIIIWKDLDRRTGNSNHALVISTTSDNPLAISTCYLTKGQPGTAVQELNYNSYWRLHGCMGQQVFRLVDQARN